MHTTIGGQAEGEGEEKEILCRTELLCSACMVLALSSSGLRGNCGRQDYSMMVWDKIWRAFRFRSGGEPEAGLQKQWFSNIFFLMPAFYHAQLVYHATSTVAAN